MEQCLQCHMPAKAVAWRLDGLALIPNFLEL